MGLVLKTFSTFKAAQFNSKLRELIHMNFGKGQYLKTLSAF
jgi:hypothetical protein